MTNASGVATSSAFKANATNGSYTVSATASGVTGTISFSLTNTAAPAKTIAATSGTPQSAQVGSAFVAPLVATVTQGGVGVAGVAVTFTAPTTGASGTFAGGVNTATTNANGVATSAVFTANATSGAYAVSATASGVTGTASFSLTNTAAPAKTIAATSGGGQSAAVITAFAAPLVAKVTQGGVGVSGVAVTFTAPKTGASGKFATSGTATETDTTNASGVATSSTFTANATAGSYAVSATATGATGAATFSLTNTAASSLAPGNYVFSLSGTDANNSFYSVAGVFTLASDGVTITDGEQDFIDVSHANNNVSLTGTVAPSNDGTGNLIITLNTTNTNIGPGGNTGTGTGTETLVATLVSSSKAVLSEQDAWATSGGTLELQDSSGAATLTPSGGYAFVVSGLDTAGDALAMGGVLNVDVLNADGSGTISGTGSIFDANDDGSGPTYTGENFGTSTVSAPNSYGRVQFTLNPTDSTHFPQIILAGYIVDTAHIRLVETADSYIGVTGGTALSQGTTTFSSISGNSYVIGLAGFDPNGQFQAAGLLTAGTTSIRGTVNYNDLTGTGVQPPDAVNGTTYAVDPINNGRVSIPNMTDGISGGANFNLQLYLGGNGNALAITLDDSEVLSGLAYQQTGGGSLNPGSFKGTYALDAFGFDVNKLDEFNAVGPVTADGVGTLAGAVDLNWITGAPPAGVLEPDLSVAGTFTAAANGIFTGTITGLDVTTPSSQDAFTYYMVDTTKVLAIETDPNQLTLGYFLMQQ